MTGREKMVTNVSDRRRRLRIAIAGAGEDASDILHLLSGAESLSIVGLVSRDGTGQALQAAHELGIATGSDIVALLTAQPVDIVLDLDGDARARLGALDSPAAPVEIVGAKGSGMLRDLLVAKKRGEERERLYTELRVAYDKIRGHEQKLQAGTEALERANEELESRLAEIFFTHEFFKALTAYSSVADVTSLVVDGANGILGAEISCVYLFDRGTWTFRFAAAQGRPESYFADVVPVGETILGRAYIEGAVVETDASAVEGARGWVTEEEDLVSQAAVPLRSGEHIIGVLVIGSATPREFTVTEMDRLQVIGNQSSLALQNALLHEELERLSVTDRLTDLYNHGYLLQRLDEEVGRAARFGHVLSLVMIDIDNFKDFNDTYGHPKGDVVLRAVSDTLRNNLREIDFAARYGGEEFVVVLPETDTAGAEAVAERIRADVAALSFAGSNTDRDVHKTISLGVATYPTHALTGAALIVAADQAMYQVKRGGKNAVRVAG
jgi:diguanylate cyclase (GGDEF)-like protein